MPSELNKTIFFRFAIPIFFWRNCIRILTNKKNMIFNDILDSFSSHFSTSYMFSKNSSKFIVTLDNTYDIQCYVTTCW